MDKDTSKIDKLISRGSFDEALSICASILERDPDNIVVLERRADAYKCAGNLEDAVRCLDRIIDLNPFGAATYFRKARWLVDMGDYDESIGLLRKAIELDFAYFGETAYFILAEIFLRQKNYPQAKEAISQVSNDFSVMHMLGYRVRTAADLKMAIEAMVK